MKTAIAAVAILGAVLLLLPAILVTTWTSSAEARLEEAEAAATANPQAVAVAAAANEEYCTPQLKQILRRVLQSCGLIEGGGRGCQPVQARSVATMDDADFNALFVPMKERGGILQYEQASAELDLEDEALIDRVFAERRGASYFFVVARASPEGRKVPSPTKSPPLTRKKTKTMRAPPAAAVLPMCSMPRD